MRVVTMWRFSLRSHHNFPVPVGKKVILRAIPERWELGTEKWVQQEEMRCHVPCGSELFGGAKRCRNCKEAVDQIKPGKLRGGLSSVKEFPPTRPL